MARWRIQRIELGSAARIGVAVGIGIGIIVGVIIGTVAVTFISVAAAALDRPFPAAGTLMVVIPLAAAALYGTLCGVLVFLSALFYNLASGVFGGLTLEIDALAAPEQAPAPEQTPSPGPEYRYASHTQVAAGPEPSSAPETSGDSHPA